MHEFQTLFFASRQSVSSHEIEYDGVQNPVTAQGVRAARALLWIVQFACHSSLC